MSRNSSETQESGPPGLDFTRSQADAFEAAAILLTHCSIGINTPAGHRVYAELQAAGLLTKDKDIFAVREEALAAVSEKAAQEKRLADSLEQHPYEYK